MYNLFVSGRDRNWEGDNFSIELSRCLKSNEYTDNDLVEEYGNLNSSDISRLKKFPCIFAYEAGCKKNPKFGYIKRVLRGRDSLTISYGIIKLNKYLSHTDIDKHLFELGISSWEMSRTHWALKEVDLKNTLNKIGIKLPKPKIDIKLNMKANNYSKIMKKWVAENINIIIITVIAGLILAYFTNLLGLTKP